MGKAVLRYGYISDLSVMDVVMPNCLDMVPVMLDSINVMHMDRMDYEPVFPSGISLAHSAKQDADHGSRCQYHK
jgi:hypothetical protein